MKSKAGRKNKYETHIKPYLKEIEKMASTATDKDIAKNLGVSLSSFMKYKNKYSDLKKAMDNGRHSLIVDLKSALIKKALGLEVVEEETININGYDENGNEKITKSVKNRHIPIDPYAANLLLKNYDRDNWSEDWHRRKLQDEELKLKVRQFEQDAW